MNNTERLEGWAQIENYLDLTRRTVLARGYPVHKDGGVFAFCDELNEHGRGKPLIVRPAGGGIGCTHIDARPATED